MTRTQPPPIVVGVDGSQESRAALRFGLNEGNLRGSSVEVVTVWRPPEPPDPLGGSADDRRQDAQRVQDREMSSVLAEYDHVPVVSRRILVGSAGPVLVRASQGAAFVVVGTGHQRVARRAVLGSVSEHCLRHASCPVVVVTAPIPTDEMRTIPLMTSATS
jgi:nucleotide-binding universal stress UspA family protein